HLAALLILGSGCNLVSRSEYNWVLGFILLFGCLLSVWFIGHMQTVHNSLKECMGMTLAHSLSSHGCPCFSLWVEEILSQELSNPLVTPHMVYVPKTDVGVSMNWFLQSKIWCEMLPKDMQVQMVVVRNIHYYIYEPTQMADGTLKVPYHFYFHKNKLQAKCLQLTIEKGVLSAHGPHVLVMKMVQEPYLMKMSGSMLMWELWLCHSQILNVMMAIS
ncbi:hypothetical protein CROQUDRAFT_45814, partial [Cronartium quercuum f. sp. fusiforme G11]